MLVTLHKLQRYIVNPVLVCVHGVHACGVCVWSVKKLEMRYVPGYFLSTPHCERSIVRTSDYQTTGFVRDMTTPHYLVEPTHTQTHNMSNTDSINNDL